MTKPRYGLLGERLGHSFSKEIHEQLADYSYELIELAPDDLPAFLQKKEFAALNVTIPYKETVLPFLDHIDPRAQQIGAVNTIVNCGGLLYGYNTDFDGVAALIAHSGVAVRDKTALVLGTGGTSKTVTAVLYALGAKAVLTASRSGKNGALTYDEALRHTEVQLIFNTTPCGMYPHGGTSPIALEPFHQLEAVLDAVYNPLRTALVQEARARGLAAAGGLYMLTAQAVAACTLFLNRALPPAQTLETYTRIAKEKENVVLIGMPGGGKSTIGALLAERMGKSFVDLDAKVEQKLNKTIAQIFAQDGEAAFRAAESEIVREFGAKTGQVLATGGGVILKDENLALLRQNGTLFFLDRPLELLCPGGGRPLAADADALRRRYAERYDRYCAVCDVRIVNNRSAEVAAARIMEVFDEDFSVKRSESESVGHP